MSIKNYNNFLSSNSNKLEETILNPNLSIVLPGGCNGNCQFCFWKNKKTCNNYLEKVNNILNSLPNQFDKISLTGGEPTISPYFEKILEIINKDKYNKVVLTTNGHKLMDCIPILEGKVDHVNISRHHYNDDINDSIFRSKMISTDDMKIIIKKLNKIGIDTTLSAVLSEKLSTKKDIKNFINYAKNCGASQVFFRKQHGTLEPTKVEKMYENYESNEYYCPVCRNKSQILYGMPVSWKASVEEPSKEIDTIYELIINENGILTKDWESNLIVEHKNIDSGNFKLFEECGGGYGGCGSGGLDHIPLPMPKSKKKKEKKQIIKFKIGDEVICIDFAQGKLSNECMEFLKTFKTYKVLDVNDKFKIDIGYITPTGNSFYFSPSRFKYKNDPDPYEEEDWVSEDEDKIINKKKNKIKLYNFKSGDDGNFDGLFSNKYKDDDDIDDGSALFRRFKE